MRLRVIYIVRDISKENSWIKYELRQFRVFKCILRKRYAFATTGVRHLFNTTTHIFLKADEIKTKLARQRLWMQHGRRFTRDASQLVLYLPRFEEFVDVEMFHQPTEARGPSTFLAVPFWFV